MLILHIGVGKAGSSTIQHTLAANRFLLAERGIVLPGPEKQRGKNYASLASALRSRKEPEVLNEFAEMLANYRGQKVAVSSEFLWALPLPAIKSLRDVTRGHDVQVVAYIREYAEWVPSFYSQASRTGKNMRDFDEFFPRILSLCSTVPFLVNWAEIFGWKNIRVRSLDRTSLEGGNLVEDFSAVLGVRLSREPDSNTSPHWTETEFLRSLYCANPRLRNNADVRESAAVKSGLQRIRGRLKACLKAHPTPDARYLTAAQLAELTNLYSKDTQFIGKHTQVDIPGPRATVFMEREFMPTVLRIPAALIARFFDTDSEPDFWSGCDLSLKQALEAIRENYAGAGVALRTAAPPS